jgi:type IV pilus assembly protein PilO
MMIKRLIPYRAYLFFILLFLCIAGATINYFVFMPMNDQIEEKNLVLQTLQNDVNRLMEQLNEPTQESDSDTLNLLMKSIPVKPYVQQIILDIEQVEKQAGVNVSNISFNNELEDNETSSTIENLMIPSEGGNISPDEQLAVNQKLLAALEAEYPGIQTVKLSTISFNLEVTADYSNFMQFITRITSLPRTIHINQIEYKSQAFDNPIGETAAPEISAIIRLSAYYSEQMGDFVNEELDIDVNEAVRRDNPLYFSTEKSEE